MTEPLATGARPDDLSWRQVSTWLFGALLIVAGTLIGLHVREVETLKTQRVTDHTEIVSSQADIAELKREQAAQLKTLVDNSEDAKDWRRKADAQFQFLIEQLIDPTARAKRRAMPGFGRDSQTFGTTDQAQH